MREPPTDSAIQLISSTGRRWLQRHRIPCRKSALADICFPSTSGNPYISRLRIDPRPHDPKFGSELRDRLIMRSSRWLLRHRYKGMLYEDQGTGLGKLTIYGETIPDTICIALTDRLMPLAAFVKLPVRFLLSSVDAQIISAKCAGGKVTLSLRTNWTVVP